MKIALMKSFVEIAFGERVGLLLAHMYTRLSLNLSS